MAFSLENKVANIRNLYIANQSSELKEKCDKAADGLLKDFVDKLAVDIDAGRDPIELLPLHGDTDKVKELTELFDLAYFHYVLRHKAKDIGLSVEFQLNTVDDVMTGRPIQFPVFVCTFD